MKEESDRNKLRQRNGPRGIDIEARQRETVDRQCSLRITPFNIGCSMLPQPLPRVKRLSNTGTLTMAGFFQGASWFFILDASAVVEWWRNAH